MQAMVVRMSECNPQELSNTVRIDVLAICCIRYCLELDTKQ
jgi:hypothetical protein